MDQLIELFHSEYDDDLLDVDLQILKTILLVDPSSKIYTVSTVLFNKYEESNVIVSNGLSHLYISVMTKSNVKLANDSMGHAQGIWIILCYFPNFPIVYHVGLVYYFPGHPYNNTSLGTLKYYVGF